jgi:hypothetical protein
VGLVSLGEEVDQFWRIPVIGDEVGSLGDQKVAGGGLGNPVW